MTARLSPEALTLLHELRAHVYPGNPACGNLLAVVPLNDAAWLELVLAGLVQPGHRGTFDYVLAGGAQ
jgi:hypothetical protein